MTRVKYEWTSKNKATKRVVNTLAEARELVKKFDGEYKTKYIEKPHAGRLEEV